jgi:hypothetical protein
MAAKVAARHLVGDCTEALVRLRDVGETGVRAAADCALRRIGAAGA